MRLAESDNPIRAWAGVHLTALAVSFLPGMIIFGWRGAMTILLVMVGASAGWLVLRRAGARGRAMEPMHVLWSSLLAAALMPGHLAATRVLVGDAWVASPLWMVPLATGLLLAAVLWLTAARFGLGALPALAAGLVAWACLGQAAEPQFALKRAAAVTGDLLDYEETPIRDLAGIRWTSRLDVVPEGEPLGAEAVRHASARETLSSYAAGRIRVGRQAVDDGRRHQRATTSA